VSVRGDMKTSQERFLKPVSLAPVRSPSPTRGRTDARSRTLRHVAAAALCAALLAAALSARGSPPASSPSPAAVALAKSKCAACHAVPPPGSRRNGWGHASMNMHHRRVALPDAEWALVREYLGVPPDDR
jgi:hypothetical protein